MSTHLQKNNYFHSKVDELPDDLDEFPDSHSKEQNQRKTEVKQPSKQSEEDSSVFKYKEYKKMYFQDLQNKPNFDGKRVHTKEDATQDKAKTKKSKTKQIGPKPESSGAIIFDVLSDKFQNNAGKLKTKQACSSGESSKRKMVEAHRLALKHSKEYAPKKEMIKSSKATKERKDMLPDVQNNCESPEKSSSLLSFEYNRNDDIVNYPKRESSNRNDSYEVMELKSFNDIKNTEEVEEDKYDDSGLYGVFEKALLQKNI